jgi:hypothetical protein
MITFKEWVAKRDSGEQYRLSLSKIRPEKTLSVPQTVARPNMMKKK